MNPHSLTASIVASLLLCAPARAGVSLVVDGRATAVVVVPARPSPVVRYAADELVYHVAKASGTKLRVVNEPVPADCPRARVFLGPTEAAVRAGLDPGRMAPESFALRAADNALYIAGRDGDGPPLDAGTWAGTLFGVYELLEDVLGVRWLWPGTLGEHIPATRSVVVPDMDRSVAPRLVIRRLRSTLDGRPAAAAATAGVISPKSLARARADERQWLRRHRMGQSRRMRWGHAFTGWWDRHGKEHPDWFNLLEDGVRGPQSGGRGDRTGMCVSNPELHARIVAEWLEACAGSPEDRPNINGCENDVFGRCQCERCRSWDPPRPDAASYPERFSRHGIVSDRYARFWRTLQELAARHHPDAIVTGYAYVNYAPPPVRERLNDHVWIGLVPDSFYPRSAEEHARCLAMWRGWAETGCRLFLRPNYTLDGYCMPHLYTHQFADEFAHHARDGMIATDFDSLTSMWAVQGPQTYLFARYQTRLDRNADELLAEYYDGFGPAAPVVRAYFDHWENHTTRNRERFREAAERLGGGWARYARVAHECFPPAAFDAGQTLLDRARTMAAPDATACARVEFLQRGLTHARKAAAAAAARMSGDFLAVQDALADLRAFRREIEGDNVVNLAYCAWIEQRSFGEGVRRDVAYTGQPLAPAAERVAPAANLAPVSLRGEFGMLARLGAGDRYRATIAVRKIGKTRVEPTRWSLRGPGGKTLAQGAIEPGKTAQIDVGSPSAGICNLILSTAGNGAQITLLNDHAVVLGRQLAFVGPSAPLHFFVPAKTKSFTVTLASPGPGETARVAVFDPSGREAASGQTGDAREVILKITVPPGQDAKAWSVAPSKATKGVLEDYTIALGDNLPAYWAHAPDRLLVPTR